MPSPRYKNVLVSLMFTSLENDADLPPFLYDDPDANELLGIKRELAGNMSRLNLPMSVKQTHAESFGQFLNVVANMTQSQLKAKMVGTAAQWRAWNAFASSTLMGNMNLLVEKVMIDKKRHPMDLMESAKTDTWSKHWVTAYGSVIANGVAEMLLGEERMYGTEGTILTTDLAIIVTQNYERLRKTQKRLSVKLAEVEAALDRATAALFDDKVTLKFTNVCTAAIGVKKFQKATSLLPNARGKADAASALLVGLMSGFGVEEKDLVYSKANQKTVEKAHQRGRQLKMDPADLADKEAVQHTVNLYLDFFQREDVELELDGETARELWDEACSDSGDMGVAKMQMKTEQELFNLLSFQNGRPVNWNSFRADSKSGTSWDETDAVAQAKFETGGDGMTELRLLWHQLVGVAAMAEKAWQTEAPFGILLADEVGVGKTAQVMAFIALLQLVYQCETNGQPRPPLLENLPSFMGKGNVPDAPHAIIVPNTLVDQWQRELKCFFKPHAIDIFVLPTARVALQDYFKRDNSPWTKSHHKEIFRVVLIPHSVFNTLTSMSFACDRRRPLDEQRELNRTAPEFFRKEWCSAWIDEAHDFRTATRSFIGAIHLRSRTRMMSCCTATPLFTKPQVSSMSVLDGHVHANVADPYLLQTRTIKTIGQYRVRPRRSLADLIIQLTPLQDVVNIGRIIGVPSFLGVRGSEWEKDNSRAWNRAQRAVSKEEKLQFRQAQEDMLLNKTTDTPTVSKEVQRLKLQYIKSIQKEYRDHIVRRTKDSKRPDGRSINDLPPLTSTVIPITLTDWEIAVLDEALGDVLQNRRNTSLTDINSEKFYIHYRLNIAYPVGSSDDGRNDFPTFKTLEQWQQRPGSKLAVLVQLLNHLLKDDAIEHVEVEGTEVKYPQPPQHEGTEPIKTRKILIYYEYPMTTPSIVSAMTVNGIHPYVINGSMKVKERDETVQAFVSSTDPDRRVLLFSSVGAAGLNLACADVVILYDMVWSDQATIQIIGRAHRLGQTRPVHVYHLLAVGTTDVIISSMAREKNEMLQALLTSTIQQAPGLNDIFKPIGEDGDEEPEDDNATTKSGPEKASGKTKPRAKKAKKAAEEDCPSGTATPTPVPSTPGEDENPAASKTTESPPSETNTNTAKASAPADGSTVEDQEMQMSTSKTPALPPKTDTALKDVVESAQNVNHNKGKGRELAHRKEDINPDGQSRESSIPPSPLTPMPSDPEDESTSLVGGSSETPRKRNLPSPKSEQPKAKRRGQMPRGGNDDDHNPHIDLAGPSRTTRQKGRKAGGR